MSEYNLSTVLLTSLLVFSAFTIGSADVATAENSSLETTANVPLEDKGIYFRGEVLYNDTVANAGEQLELRDGSSNELVRYVTADDSGAFVVNSTFLSGEYYLVNESRETVIEFEIVKQIVDFRYQNYYYVDDGTATHVLDLKIDSNRHGDYDIALESPTLNLTKRVEGARDVNGTTFMSYDALPAKVNVGGLEDDTYRIDANVTDTTGSGNITFRPSNFTHVEFERQVTTVEVVENGSYWGSHSLAYDHGRPNEILNLRNDNGTFLTQAETNESGWATFESEFETGTYYLENDTSRSKLVNFSLTAQTVEASFDDATVENETGETNLSVSSNRSGYDVLFWAKNVSRETLSEAIPASTVTGEGDLVVRNLSANDSVTFNYSTLPVGSYTLYISSNDTAAKSAATLTVNERSSGGGGGGGSGGGGGGGNVPPPSVRVEVVEEGAQYLRAKITSARADSPASVSLSGLGTADANFQKLEVAPESSDAQPRFFLNASVVNTPAVHAPKDVESLAYLHVNPTYVGNEELGSVTVRFRTAKDSTDPETVVLYRYVDGAWKPLDTEFVGERDGDYVFRATATGVSLFAVGVDDSEALGDDSGSATETQTTLKTTTTTSERSAMESGKTRTDTAAPSSGPVGHDVSSVLGPLIAILLAIGFRVRNH